MSRILITGGSGFIGSNLIELFEMKRYDLVNYDKSVPLNISQKKYWVKGNLLEPHVLKKEIDKFKPNIVIHLAARTDCDSNKIEDYVDNTEGTQNLIDCVKNSSFIERVIITSTQYVYKSKAKPFPLSDDEYLPYTTYGESKVITERITRNADLSCCWTIVRPTNVWGPWHLRYPNELWKMISKGFYFHPGKKEVIRTYAYVKNVVHQIDEIINAPAERVNKKTFYLGDLPIDSYIWLNELSKEIKNKEIKRIPVLVFLLPSLIGSFLRKIGIPFPLYKTRFNNMIEDFYAPTNITINEFGLYNAKIEDNVKETINWLRNEGGLMFPHWGKNEQN
jgi:GlcNAc-P-P-Und epimerase